MNLHREQHFESEIYHHLVGRSWLYDDAQHYDRADGLYLPDLLA